MKTNEATPCNAVGSGGSAGPARPDAALVEGLRRGSPGSYEALVRDYGSRMLSVARRLARDEDEARDCVQDALMQVVRHVGRFESRSSLSTWLHRIVVNCVLLRRRAAGRKPEVPMEGLDLSFDRANDRLESVERAIDRKRARVALRRAVGRLPAGYRRVVELRDLGDHDTAQTARLMGLSEGAVRVRLHRARGQLRELLLA